MADPDFFSPVLPYLKPALPVRVPPSVRCSADRADQIRAAVRSRCYSSFTGGQIDQALDTVRDDIRQLWIRSKYCRDLPGIVTYSGGLGRKDSMPKPTQRLASPENQSPPPFLVTVHSKKVQIFGRHRARYDYLPHKPASVLRVSLPSPKLPAAKRKPQAYTLRKIPAPLGIYKKYQKSEVMNRSLMDYVSGAIVEEQRLSGQKDELEGTETCPLTALRTYESEKKDDMQSKSFCLVTQKSMDECMIPASPRPAKGTLFTKTRKCKATKRRQKGLSFNEIPLKVTPMAAKHQGSDSISGGKQRYKAKPCASRKGKMRHPPLRTPHSDASLLTISSFR